MKKLMAVVFSAGLALAAQAVGWKGLGEGNYYAGPKVTEADLAGKVVYSGQDERAAIQAVVEAITEIGAPPTLIPGVILSRKSPYKSLEKRLILGKPAASVVKKLQGDIKEASAKSATAVQKAAAEEAEAMLKAIEEAKTDYTTDIARLKTTNPPEALKMIKAYMASFPAEGAEYKDEIADLTVKAKEFAAEQKAKGAKK